MIGVHVPQCTALNLCYPQKPEEKAATYPEPVSEWRVGLTAYHALLWHSHYPCLLYSARQRQGSGCEINRRPIPPPFTQVCVFH